MTTQSTMDKLIEMRLTAMSDAFRTQISDPKMKEISFEDRFGMLVDIEYSNRKSNSLKRLIRNAGFDQPDAYIGDINYTSGRKLNRSLIERLATCEYITEHRNLFITGATGSGKTYLACAFGMEACRQRYKTKYVRLPDLLLELEMARNDGTYKKVCFLQALFPQKCRLNSSKLHGEFPQYCISSAGTLSGAGEEPLQAYKVY